MRPEPLSGVGRLLRLLHARGTDTRGMRARRVRRFGAFLCPSCADAGHPPGLFAE